MAWTRTNGAMISVLIFLVTFASIAAGVGLGVLLRRRLPDDHLEGGPKEVVRLGAGFIATLAALVIGLMIASAKSNYDAQNTNIRQFAANLILLDELLAHYGPETGDLRRAMRAGVGTVAARIWRENRDGVARNGTFTISSDAERFYAAVEALSPASDEQRMIKPRILQTTVDIGRIRLAIFVSEESPILVPFLAILIIWLTVIFASYSLFAEFTAVVSAALLIFALSISSALFLVVDLSQPFAGVMQISSTPLRNTLPPLN
jgi:hypothetical protein